MKREGQRGEDVSGRFTRMKEIPGEGRLLMER